MVTQYAITGESSNQIASSVESGVRSGDLTPDAQLPPVRTLADRLGVSPGTVAAAYKALRQRGVIATDGRRGTRVLAKPAVVPRYLHRLPVPPGARDVSGGEPNVKLLPALGPRLRRLAPEPVAYSAAGLLPEFTKIALDRLRQDGVPATRVTATSGALDGIERALAARLAPGDVVAVEDPGWSSLLDLLAGMNLRTEPVTLDDAGPRPEDVRRAINRGAKALVVTSRAHNPTGASVTKGRAAELRRVLHDQDVLVIEDDHAAELSDQPLHSLAGATDAWAFVRSVSKPYGPDLRCATFTADDETLARVEGRLWLGARWVSSILQALVVRLWTDPAVDALIHKASRHYDTRRETLLRALAARNVPATGRSGLNVWVPVADETAACAHLLEAGWVVAPGRMFRLSSPPGVRITVSTLEGPDEIERLADAVAQAAHPTPRRPVA
ncbi:transcriptional regulator domain-containing protein [Flindersiella endophytica]